MRPLILVLAALLISCTAEPPSRVEPTPAATHEAGTIAVTALLDLSGNRAPRGDGQRNAMQQWSEAQRGAPRLKLRLIDVAGSDAKVLLELKRLAESGEADAVIIGVPVIQGEALSLAIGRLARPVVFTLPLADPVTSAAGGRWMFGLAPSPGALARAVVDSLPSQLTPAVVVTSGSPTSGRDELAIGSVFRSQDRPPPFVMSAASDQRDTFGQRLRPFARSGSAVFFTGAAADYLSPSRLLPNDASGANVFLSYLTDANDGSRLGDVAPVTRWPALRRTVGTPLGTHAATATDALALLASTADGTGDPERSRANIENGTFAGIVTTYSFTPSRHTGVDLTEITLVSWENGRIVAARPIAATR